MLMLIFLRIAEKAKDQELEGAGRLRKAMVFPTPVK
jgi:hypothetical protein